MSIWNGITITHKFNMKRDTIFYISLRNFPLLTLALMIVINLHNKVYKFWIIFYFI